MALGGTAYFSYELGGGEGGLEYEQIGLWLAIVILITYTLMAEKQDAIIMNGALMALYLAATTYHDSSLLKRIEYEAQR